MKLLLDQNLSHKLCSRLADAFPGSVQARLIGMDQSDDAQLWQYAKAHGLVIVTTGCGFREHESPARASAQNHLAALRQPAKLGHRNNPAHEPDIDPSLCRRQSGRFYGAVSLERPQTQASLHGFGEGEETFSVLLAVVLVSENSIKTKKLTFCGV